MEKKLSELLGKCEQLLFLVSVCETAQRAYKCEQLLLLVSVVNQLSKFRLASVGSCCSLFLLVNQHSELTTVSSCCSLILFVNQLSKFLLASVSIAAASGVT